MPLSFRELNDMPKVFAELNRTYGRRPSINGVAQSRKWTVADLTFTRPTQEALSSVDSNIEKPFTIELGRSDGTKIEVKVTFSDWAQNKQAVTAGSIKDK